MTTTATQTKLVSVTPDAEKTMAYVARVSNPKNQDNEKFAGLLRYCIEHGHWSVFEQAHMTVEINTTRGLAAQILRHRSFTYQEFSQRYQDVSFIREDIPLPELRRQDLKNRQNSIDDIDPITQQNFEIEMRKHFDAGIDLYKKMLHAGIAKECARFVLPLATPTRLYMTGSVRSWVHYINLRSAHGTQKEHMDLVENVRKIFIEQFPTVAEAFRMEIKTEVVDNFLEIQQLNMLKEMMVFSDFPYQITKIVAGKEESQIPHWYWYGTHVFYDNCQPMSNAFDALRPLIKRIVDLEYGFAFIRGKVNFYPYTETVYEHGPHVDYPFPNYGAVLSLNTCDGFTRLSDGTKVESVENRMVFFDSSQPHNSSTTSNASGRFNINLNFR